MSRVELAGRIRPDDREPYSQPDPRGSVPNMQPGVPYKIWWCPTCTRRIGQPQWSAALFRSAEPVPYHDPGGLHHPHRIERVEVVDADVAA